MDLFCQYALAAAEMAMKESGLPIGPDKPNGYDPERVGSSSARHRRRRARSRSSTQQGAARRGSTGSRPSSSPDDHQHGARAASRSATAPRARTGPRSRPAHRRPRHRRGAAKSIQRGETDAMIAGGAEAAITPLGIGGFTAMKALSTRNDDPSTASRPFDKDRDGFVMGEGAGIVVLEELEHAKKRGAQHLRRAGRLRRQLRRLPRHRAGAGRRGRGALHAAGARRRAGSNPAEIGYINAHGTSTPFNDANETKAIKTVFGDHAQEADGQLHQVDDRPHARRGRRRRGGRSARWRCTRERAAADHQLHDAGSRTATSTTCRTRRARCG